LLKDAGLTWQTPRPHSPTANEDERAEIWETTKKLDNSVIDEYTIVAVDQTQKAIGCDLYRSWFPGREWITLPFCNTRNRV
jgi:hypothetical protein